MGYEFVRPFDKTVPLGQKVTQQWSTISEHCTQHTLLQLHMQNVVVAHIATYCAPTD